MIQTKRLVNDWQAIRNKLDVFPWAEHIARQLKSDTDQWIVHYQDDPSRIAGWGHHYFCNLCSSALVFDPSKPNEHYCGECGALRQDEDVNEAWCATYRSTACTHVFRAAVLYNLHSDPTYLDYIRKVLNFYCDHFESFKVRTPPGFEGQFSGINLSDAVAVCWMLNGLELVREQLTETELERYKHRLFLPMADFLHKKSGGTPNISIWMKSALGMIGLFFHEREWCQRAADGEEGIKRKLADGLLPQGFWYESSFVYHFLCADGLTYYAAFCELYEYEFPELTQAVRMMYRYPSQYAFPNGLFPSPNDGWPLTSFRNYAHQYEWIRNIYDEPPFRYALAHGYDEFEPNGTDENTENTANIGGIPRLLFGTNWRSEWEAYERDHGESITPLRLSLYDEDIHYCMLQNEQASVFLKYGFVIKGHSHADVMNFELFLQDELISRDISNSGYGSDLFREWQRKSIAHNTVIVDRHNQPNRPPGQMLAFDATNNSCKVAADNVYPNLTFTRYLHLCPDRLIDEFTVTSTEGKSEEHTFDWLFHCSGELQCDFPMQSTQPPGEEDGYQLMLDVQSCTTDDDWEVSWLLPNKKLTLAMTGSPGTTVYLFKGYEHRADLQRWGVMVRRTGSTATFQAEYRFAVTCDSAVDSQ